jgi:hypothetical protein
MDDPILRRRQAGVPDLVEALSDRIPPTDLQTVLLEVARRRPPGGRPATCFASTPATARWNPQGRTAVHSPESPPGRLTNARRTRPWSSRPSSRPA